MIVGLQCMKNGCEEINTFQYGLGIVFLLLEYWLGKTEKVKASSMVDLVINVVRYVWIAGVFWFFIILATITRRRYGDREKGN